MKHRRLYKKRMERDIRLHDELVREIYDDPELLKIESLRPEAILHKEIEPKKFGDPNIHFFDVFFIYESNTGYEILGIEVKLSGYGKSIKESDFGMGKSRKYVRKKWRGILNSIRNKLDLSKDTDIWLDSFVAYKDLTELKLTKPPVGDFRRERLGAYP